MVSRAVRTLLLIVLLIAGCGRPAGAVPLTPPSAAEESPASVPDADRAAVTALIDAINSRAAGPVAAQQALLRDVVAPGFAAAQAACAPATITIRIDPVLADLQSDPDFQPTGAAAGPSAGDSAGATAGDLPARTAGSSASDTAGGTASGSAPLPIETLYRVPALLEVYTGAVRTATDMTNLRLLVTNGSAHTFPLCLV